MSFRDGGAYALLGPSGCGKTTVLYIISGLLTPSQGSVRFDGGVVTLATPQQRNIAQVFQFPVIYDTMSVFDNLAFPLRNRGVPADKIKQRVGVIAEMLEMSGQLNVRAAGLAADAKQKISLGRGLVRTDVAAILLDEPLTVIDPHLKWQLRRKLKQIHAELKLTLIYVTHDQVEALTFAEEVVVMTRGKAVQIGSAEALFERPAHTFVGHFIGSPGMNFLAAQSARRRAGSRRQHAAGRATRALPEGALKLGIRPEYVALAAPEAAGAVPATVDAGAGHRHLLAADGAQRRRPRCFDGAPRPDRHARGGRHRLAAGRWARTPASTRTRSWSPDGAQRSPSTRRPGSWSCPWCCAWRSRPSCR